MKKRIIFFLGSLTMLVALSLPTGGRTQFIGRVIEYKVYWGTCVISPMPPANSLEGEWTRDCDGTLTGWGIPPYFQSCHTTVMILGPECPQE